MKRSVAIWEDLKRYKKKNMTQKHLDVHSHKKYDKLAK